MSTARNPFVWSLERHDMFQTCPRQYYFAFYGAWGGWNEQAPAQARQLYILKRLHPRQQWAAQHIGQALADLIQHARQQPDGPAEIAVKQVELMRQEFRESRSGAYRRDPARIAALYEHEYRVAVPPEDWKAIVDTVAVAVRQIAASPFWNAWRDLPDDAFIFPETRAGFDLQGLRVQTRPNLAVCHGGRVVVHDWTAAALPSPARRLRMGLHVLLALEQWTADPAAVQAVAWNLPLGDQETLTFDAEDLDTIREFIMDSAEEMLFPLEDPQQNLAGGGDLFDFADNPGHCPACSFLKVCPRWKT